MNDWMIPWAFAAPFVTLGAQPCGRIVVLALAAYGLAFLATRVRSCWEWGFAVNAGLLILLAGFSVQTIFVEPVAPEQLRTAQKLAAVGFLTLALLPWLLGGISSLQRPLLGVWDVLFGLAYALGFISCGPYLATLSTGVSARGWPGLVPLAAYTLGLLILTSVLMLPIALTHHFLWRRTQRARSFQRLQILGLSGLVAAGILGLWR